MPVKVVRFGPGTLKLGTAPGTDFSCQVQSLGIDVEKDSGDSITVLCGDMVPGSIAYTYALTGTVLQDLITAGLSEYSWTNAGKTVAFEFVPQTGATTFKATGSIIMDPISIGASDGEYGDVMTSDVEWSCTAKPTIIWATVLPTGLMVETNMVDPEAQAQTDDADARESVDA